MKRGSDITSTPPGESPTPDVQFRVVEKGALGGADVARMVALLTSAFGRWPAVDIAVTPAEHLRWKTSSPATVCAAVLGESGETLVTTDTAMAFPMRLRGREALRVQFVDHAVRPDWRGRGWSSASIAFRQRAVAPRYDLSISDAQSPTMIHRAMKFGTRRLGNEIHPLVLPLRRRDFTRRWARGRGLPGWVGRPFEFVLEARRGALARRHDRAAGTRHASSIVAVERFDPRIDRFFAEAGEPWDLIVVRSGDHLDWRYCDSRAGHFRKLVAQDPRGAILGYAVTSRRDDRGLLADLLALPGRTDVVAVLVIELIAELERAGCVDVLCWLPRRHPYREVLRRAGFLDARDPPMLTFRPGRAAPEDLDFLAAPETRIHFTLGDTDLV